MVEKENLTHERNTGAKLTLSTLSFVEKLASKTRYAGTVGERNAYYLISEEFEKLGCKVEREETEYIKSTKFLILINLLTYWLTLVFIIISWLIHPLTVALLIIAVFGGMAKLVPKVTLRLAKTKSINVTATVNPEKQHRLILCGHYDSSQIKSKFAQKHEKRITSVIPAMELAFIVYFVLLFVRGAYLLVVSNFNFASLIDLKPNMLGLWSVIWWGYTIVFLAVIVIGTYYGITMFTDRYSYGADDNASGIAVMMETAKRLHGKDLNLRIDFISFAAEEKGLFGSTKWVDKHVKEIDKERTYVLNLDCVGRGERFFIIKGLGMIFKKRSDQMLLDLLASVFSELQLPYEECWSGSSDHVEFVNKRFRTCAIFRFNIKKANIAQTILRNLFRIPVKTNNVPDEDWIHTEKDTVDGIDGRKLEETTLSVVRFIERLNEKMKSAA
jgi:hypothetical protein